MEESAETLSCRVSHLMQAGVPSEVVDVGIIDTGFDVGIIDTGFDVDDEVDTIRTACRIPGVNTGVG